MCIRDREAAAKAAKAAQVKFRWGKSLKSAPTQAEEFARVFLFFIGNVQKRCV